MSEIKKEWPKSNRQLAKFLGVTENSLRAHKRRHSRELIESEDYTYENLGVAYAPTLMTAWSKNGAVKLAHYCRSARAREFLENEGIQKLHVNYIEGEVIDIIIDAVEGLTACCKQYTVEGYRIDLYLRDINLAIECDEMGHENKDDLSEIIRQKTIEKKLGCTFLRFNPDDKNFKIGKIFNQIINQILQKSQNI
jgi:very-short-patch-repair endonuclease